MLLSIIKEVTHIESQKVNKYMEEQKIRVVIVDDSAFMRIALERMLKEDPTIQIVGSAGNGIEAIERVGRLKPDVVTMDVEMPLMDGLQALKEIMSIRPTPVLMVSSLTHEGAKVTLDALDLGAVDYIPKPGSTFTSWKSTTYNKTRIYP